MIKSTVIFLLSMFIILQNTCLLGAAGESIIFRALNEDGRTHCQMSAHAQSSSDKDGIKSYKNSAKNYSKPAFCYFQFNIEGIITAAAFPLSGQAEAHGEDQLKHLFLDPPIKPPAIVISS